MAIYELDGQVPVLPESGRYFIAETAAVIGRVRLRDNASVWFGAVLRGDDPANGIRVGARTSIQDNCVLHVSARAPTIVEDAVTVGHGAVFESCTIRSGALIGMNAVVLHNAEIGPESLVAAGCVVPEGMVVPARTLVAGVPARVRRQLDGSESWIAGSAAHYVELAAQYLREHVDAGGSP